MERARCLEAKGKKNSIHIGQYTWTALKVVQREMEPSDVGTEAIILSSGSI